MDKASNNATFQGQCTGTGKAIYGESGKISELRAGDRCPGCGKHNLDYDGLLNLACPTCGEVVGMSGGFS